jgi:integration host factor subunit alpha
MTTTNLTRADIVTGLVREAGLSRSQATHFLEAAIETMSSSLAGHRGLKISSFGSFVVHQKLKRLGRNPKTGKEAVITPRCVISFKPSQYLKEKVQRRRKT